MRLREPYNNRSRKDSTNNTATKAEISKSEYTQGSQKRGVKQYLISKGVKIQDMRSYLLEFFAHYGHNGMEDKTLSELQVKASVFFKSLISYTNRKLKA